MERKSVVLKDSEKLTPITEHSFIPNQSRFSSSSNVALAQQLIPGSLPQLQILQRGTFSSTKPQNSRLSFTNEEKSSSSSSEVLSNNSELEEIITSTQEFEDPPSPLFFEVGEAIPLIKSGINMKPDMHFGWKPETTSIPGAPIPLHYNFRITDIPPNPITNQRPNTIYLGPRIPTSLQVHKIFANRPEVSSCEEQPSYKTEVASKLSLNYSNKEPLRQFIGMDPKMDLIDELQFDSFFESGNLDMVTKAKNFEYDLYMRIDTNSTGHQQWFYFSISYHSTQLQNQKITFNICNFTKPQSLYNYGMRVCMAKQSQKFEWHKGGENIEYSPSRVLRINQPDCVRYHYNLRFQITLDKPSDKIYFAYCYPYTVSKLTNFLKSLHVECKERGCLKQSALCKDLSGFEVPLLTVTSRLLTDKQYSSVSMAEFQDQNSLISLPLYKKKKYCIVGARVHPGETPASWMMQGFLKCLTGTSYQAEQLRKRVIFKIVPMVNPDGVVIGNYRTSMAGCDLNRRYDDPDFRFHPTVWSIKNMCEDLTQGDLSRGFGPITSPDDIIAFVDMHGHSRKKNVFIYGPPLPLHSSKYLQVRVIPKLLSEETEMFRFFGCRFQNDLCKARAARIVLWKELAINNCFTLEASFHSYFDSKKVNHEFTTKAYEEMGAGLVNSLYEYMMILEEEDRKKQLKKIAKIKRVNKDPELTRIKSPQVKLVKSSQQSKTILQTIEKSKKTKRVKKHRTCKPSSVTVADPTAQNQIEPENPNEPPEFGNLQIVQPVDPQKLPATRFRNLADIFADVQKITQNQDSSEGEPGTDEEDFLSTKLEEEDTGELDLQQEKILQKEIIKAVKDFAKSTKTTTQDYYGRIGRKAKLKREQQKLQQLSLLNVNYQSETVANLNKRRSQVEFKVENLKIVDEAVSKKKVLPGLQKSRIFPASPVFQTVTAPKQPQIQMIQVVSDKKPYNDNLQTRGEYNQSSADPSEFSVSFIKSNFSSNLKKQKVSLEDVKIPQVRTPNILSPLKISNDLNEPQTVIKIMDSLQQITGSEHSKLQYLNMQQALQNVQVKTPTQFVFDAPVQFKQITELPRKIKTQPDTHREKAFKTEQQTPDYSEVIEPSYEVFKNEMKKGMIRLQNLKKKENQAFKNMMTRRVKMLDNQEIEAESYSIRNKRRNIFTTDEKVQQDPYYVQQSKDYVNLRDSNLLIHQAEHSKTRVYTPAADYQSVLPQYSTARNLTQYRQRRQEPETLPMSPNQKAKRDLEVLFNNPTNHKQQLLKMIQLVEDKVYLSGSFVSTHRKKK